MTDIDTRVQEVKRICKEKGIVFVKPDVSYSLEPGGDLQFSFFRNDLNGKKGRFEVVWVYSGHRLCTIAGIPEDDQLAADAIGPALEEDKEMPIAPDGPDDIGEITQWLLFFFED